MGSGSNDIYVVMYSYKLANNRKDLFNMKIRLDYSIYKLVNKEKNSIEKFGDKLSSLNPIEIINKGYAIIDKDKAIITTINEISADDIVNIKKSPCFLRARTFILFYSKMLKRAVLLV